MINSIFKKVSKSWRKKAGVSLIEIVVALGVIGLVVLGIVRMVTVSVKNSEYSRNKSLGLNLAQSKFEEIRKDKETLSWTVFWDEYLGDLAARTLPVEENLQGIFSRTTELKDVSEETIKSKMEIIIKVAWSDSWGSHLSSVSGILANWR